ncbi:hypothetical protein HYV22_01355 [Candidatus Gottesmanbacteria bacterium]|nr:hypothetical protein [Candidatus Gottesmanbacteria bacterium]
MAGTTAQTLVIKSLEYNNRVLKYVLIPEYLQKLVTHGNLKEALLKVHLAVHDQVVEDILSSMFSRDVSDQTKEKVLTLLRKNAELESKKNIDDYLPIILNQTLVTLCTVLDTFMVDSLRVITTFQPKILEGLASDDVIRKKDVFATQDLSGLIARVQEKVLSEFDYMGMKDKLKNLSDKLNVDTAGALQLKYHKSEVQEHYKSKGNFLFDVYEKRIAIVHRDQHQINSFEELSEISTYISYFILDLGIILGKHFHIDTDFWQFLRQKPKDLTLSYEHKKE